MGVYLGDKFKRPTGVKGGLWFMNGNLNDSSGNGHSGGGTVSFSTGKFGQCLNATNYYASIINNSDFNPVDSEPFSIGFWFKPTGGLKDGTIWGIMSKSSTGWRGGSGFAFWKGSGTQVIRFTFGSDLGTGSSQVLDLSELTITANTRSQIIVTYDGTTVRYYQNGVLLGSKSMPNRGTGTNSSAFQIGHTSGDQPFYAKGYMDEVFYMKNYCLSQAEITAIQSGFYGGTDNPLYELKNAYIGEVYEYSYDFRGKTASQITTDGWTYTNTPLFDSDGMYYSTWNSVLDTTISQIGTHNKVTLECTFSVNRSYDFALACYLVNSSKTNQYGLYTDSGTGNNKLVKISGTDVYSTTTILSSGNYNLKLVLDLSNKTYNCSSPYSVSGSLTDAQITALRQYKNVRLLVAHPGIRFKTLNVTYK